MRHLVDDRRRRPDHQPARRAREVLASMDQPLPRRYPPTDSLSDDDRRSPRGRRPSRFAARWRAPSAALPSTSPRRPCCWPPAARTSTGCAPWRRGSATPGWSAAGRPGVVTYSPKVFIPVTRLCRDRCHYCTFVTTPGQLERDGQAPYLSPDEILEIARQGAALGCKEALFTLGDRPEDRWPEAREWLDEQGYDSTLDYVRAMAIRVLEETGLLPHLNPGVMSWEEMNRLKPVSPVDGDDAGDHLARGSSRRRAQAHYGSPDKDPAVRLRVLEDAGRLSVPFTTGLLVGIGENLDRAGRVDLRAAPGRPASTATSRKSSSRTSAPSRTPRCGTPTTSGSRSTSPRSRSPGSCSARKVRVQAPPNLVDLDGVPGAARRRRRRLGRRLPADPGPREPRAPVALAGAAALDHRRGRLRRCGRG